MTDRIAAAADPHSVVGLDGSESSMPAMRWAIAHADLFGPPEPMLVWHYPAAMWSSPLAGPDTLSVETMQSAAEKALAAALDELDPADHLPPVVRHGDPATQLVEQATDAGLLVVGTRGLGAVRGRLLGSVGCYCADHAPVPVVIVPAAREGAPHGPGRRVVVGVDGSDNADAALRWALMHSRDDDEIIAVGAWETVASLGTRDTGEEVELLEKLAVETVDEVAHRVTGELGIAGSRVERRHERGDPRSVLRRLAYEADLVVVGARGRSGLPHLFLGSTASTLAHRPISPLAIVPAGDRSPDADPES